MHKVLLTVVLSTLVLMPSPVMAETPVGVEDGSDQLLSTTLLGRLEPGGEPRLAVRWDGPDTEWLDVWVDFDGDGVVGPGELVIAGRPLEPGIEVIDLEIPDEFFDVAQPRLSVRTLNTEPAGWDEVGSRDEAGCGWQLEFYSADLDDSAYAFAVFDDGTGPALYVGGYFDSAGGMIVNHIAKWDGNQWSGLPGGLGIGIGSSVRALVVFDDGGGAALYAGGYFTHAGGVTVNCIGKWDGEQWAALEGPSGNGMDHGVLALAVYDDGGGQALYAGGVFSTAGGVTVNGIAKWDGMNWSALSGSSGVGVGGADPGVQALAVYGDGDGEALFAGGDFVTAGGITVNSIAKWDGSEWSTLSGPSGVGMNDAVVALAGYDDGTGMALYAGGQFTDGGGLTVNHIAKWDGTAWSALSGPSGTGVDDSVRSLTVYDDGDPALFVGGSFLTAGGVTVNGVARWDGQEWFDLTGPSGTGVGGVPYSRGSALTVFDHGGGSALYVGGWFSQAGGLPVSNIAMWDGSTWGALAGGSDSVVDRVVGVLEVFDDGGGPALYAGGPMVAGGLTVNGIAKWDGMTWSGLSGPAGMGMSEWPSVRALAVYDDYGGEALYAGGSFVAAGGVEVNNIAKWDGAVWSVLSGPSGIGVDDWVTSLAVYDDGSGGALYIGGDFNTAGGVTVNRIAKWDGSVWSALNGPSGIGVDAPVWALAVYDDGFGEALYVGGSFDTAGGIEAIGIAKWDGTAWSAVLGASGMGLGPYADVRALEVYDDGSAQALYAGGGISSAGGVDANSIAQWNGSEWSVLSGSSGTGVGYGHVEGLVVYDDGSGSALYVGGNFAAAGGVPSRSIARWDGSEWSALSGPSGTGVGGLDPWVYALGTFDDGGGEALFVGGIFPSAGGVASKHIAKWMCNYRIFTDGFESGDTSGWSVTQP